MTVAVIARTSLSDTTFVTGTLLPSVVLAFVTTNVEDIAFLETDCSVLGAIPDNDQSIMLRCCTLYSFIFDLIS